MRGAVSSSERDTDEFLQDAVASTKKQSQEIFSIILFRTDDIKKNKIWRIYSWVYLGHNCSWISNETCVIPLPEMVLF